MLGRALALLAVISCGCGSRLPFAPAGPGAAPDPSDFGPFPVGVETVVIEDPARTSSTGVPRRLVVELWYPAAESARGGPGTDYRFVDALPADKAALLGERALGSLHTEAVRGAPIAEEGEDFPLVLFSHANGALRMQSTYLTVPLASHGFVVAAPDHAGNTLTELLASDEVDVGAQLLSFQDRPRDLGVVLDALLRAQVAPKIAARIDPSAIGTLGHSFGAVTAIRTAGLEPRIRAVVAQAPAGYDVAWLDLERPLNALGIPVMIEVGGLDHTLPGDAVLDSYRPWLGAPHYLARFSTAGHFSFSDLCTIDVEAAAAIGVNVGSFLSDGCGPENMPSSVAFPLFRRLSIGLFNHALRRSPGSAAYLGAGSELLRLDVDPGAP
ncbi:MAG: dienelactone hydrolase family protein [Myxococcota bacterium]